MILEEIKFDDTIEGKRKAIMDSLGQQVILKDFHSSWCHGRIRDIGYDSSVYEMIIYDGRKAGQFHYHDLEQLIIAR